MNLLSLCEAYTTMRKLPNEVASWESRAGAINQQLLVHVGRSQGLRGQANSGHREKFQGKGITVLGLIQSCPLICVESDYMLCPETGDKRLPYVCSSRFSPMKGFRTVLMKHVPFVSEYFMLQENINERCHCNRSVSFCL